MAVPGFESFMLPMLQMHSDRQAHKRPELRARLADHFSLTEADREEKLPSGKQRRINSRVNWAAQYLTQAGLLRSAGTGITEITNQGVSLLATPPEKIDKAFLSQYESFKTFIKGSGKKKPKGQEATEEFTDGRTPIERMEAAYEELRNALAQDLLARVQADSPEFFESLVVDLFLAMGYGGSRQDAGERLGGSGDNGVDGVIREDRLGLDVIYLQAKRWASDHVVRRPDVQAFIGALEGMNAQKGIFITTSRFTNDAEEYARKISRRVVLIDGETLAQLMIDHGVGVTTAQEFQLQRVDADYFEASAGLVS